MPYWNFEYTRAVISTVENVGGGIGQDPATEVTHVGLNQPLATGQHSVELKTYPLFLSLSTQSALIILTLYSYDACDRPSTC